MKIAKTVLFKANIKRHQNSAFKTGGQLTCKTDRLSIVNSKAENPYVCFEWALLLQQAQVFQQ